MRNLMLVVEYDGTDYQGFQAQTRGRTVQGELESALERITGEHIRIAGAGRTDAGAHALGQVVTFRTSSGISTQAFKRALNWALPRDVSVRDANEVAEGFHARHNAVRRWYRYTIVNREAPPAMEWRYAYHTISRLDSGAMDEACAVLTGTHDFRAFGSGRSTIRTLERARCCRHEDHVLVDLVANGFLKGMVRNIVGTLIKVGRGRAVTSDVLRILDSGEPALAGPSVPAKGLCLMAVYYREADTSEYL